MKVETGELLSIGRLARLTGLTVKALRHYDAEGLLSPARVDEWTGYRYYAAGQTRDAIAIRRLRELELPLDEIAAVLHAEPARVRERLAVHRARLQGRAVEVQQLVGTLDRLIEGKEPLVQETMVQVTLEDLPELRVAVIAERVAVDDMFMFVPATIERVLDWLAERRIECTSPPVTFLRDPVHGIENDSIDVGVGFEAPEGTVGDGPVAVRTSPAVRAAVHEHRGPHDGLPAVYDPLRSWILDNGFDPGKEAREIYSPTRTTRRASGTTTPASAGRSRSSGARRGERRQDNPSGFPRRSVRLDPDRLPGVRPLEGGQLAVQQRCRHVVAPTSGEPFANDLHGCVEEDEADRARRCGGEEIPMAAS
jgi:DNA-binding transcriptional MerR regulator